MKKKVRKMTLSRETLRHLDTLALGGVAGGAPSTTVNPCTSVDGNGCTDFTCPTGPSCRFGNCSVGCPQ